MPYTGDTLSDLVGNLHDASMRAGHELADAMVDHGKSLIERNTPVETHHLRDSYDRTKIERLPDVHNGVQIYVWTGRVFTEVEYALFVERGTGLWGPKHQKYKIAPKQPGGVLAFAPYSRMPNGGVILDVQGAPLKSGGTVIVRYVMHPGSPGAHMFQIGSIMTEAEHEEWEREPLRAWKEMVESPIGNKVTVPA